RSGNVVRGGHAMSEPEAFQVLIERVRAGDAEAAAELVRRYEPMVRRAARVRLVDPRLGRVLDSMDICQSVMASFFVRAALGQYELNSPDQLLKLLATMARNTLANQAHGQRAARRDLRRVEGGGDEAAEGAGRRRAGKSRHVNSSTRPGPVSATPNGGSSSIGKTAPTGSTSPPPKGAARRPSARSSPAPSTAWRKRSGWTNPTMAEPDAVPEVHTLLIDQRRRVQLGEPFHVELYLSQHPGLAADPEGLLDLIYNEVLLRGQRGESPELDDYRTRFPNLAEALGDLFEVHRAIESSPEVSTAPVFERSAVPVLEPAWPKLDGYEIVGIFGSGGMGIVYRARDLKRGVTVAVKTMRQADAASLYRFKQEFRALLDVSHPNLVALHELISDGIGWFIVMEYIDGLTFLDYIHDSPCRGDDPTSSPNLETTWWDDDLAPVTLAPVDNPATESRDGRPSGGADVVDRKATPAPGPLTWVKLRGALRQLAEGLSALHQAGKLHRDIK